MIHDFAVTRNWIVVPIFPLTCSMERAMGGQPPFAWEPDKGTHIAFIPRNGTVADVRWVTAPACYVFHPMNALRDRRRQGRDRRDEVRRGAALPAARRLAVDQGDAGGAAVPLDLRPHGQGQHLPGGAARRPRRRVPALRRALLHERLSPRLDRLGQRHRRQPRPRARDGIAHYDLASGRNAAPGMPAPTTASASRCSCRAAPMPPKATAGC